MAKKIFSILVFSLIFSVLITSACLAGFDHKAICMITKVNHAKRAGLDTLSIDSLKKLVKKHWSVDSLTFDKDTLKILLMTNDLYYPLGKAKDIRFFNSKQNLFRVQRKSNSSKTSNQSIIYRLVHKRSYITFFKDPENKLFQVVSANLLDGDIILNNGLHTGLSKSEVLKLLFDYDVSQYMRGINVIKLIPSVDGIVHYYYFKDNYLRIIKLNSDYIF